MVEPTDSKIRRLRFDLDVQADESVPGTIARGVAGHHLVRLKRVLKEADLGRYAGNTQLADPDDLARIAYVIRCDATRLTTQAGRRLIEPGESRLQHFVDFDGLVLPRSHLELRRRRISPLSLTSSPHHRQAWLITVLPYCPVTLERLVDTCPHCGSPLGWTNSTGIDRCESDGCQKVIPPNAECSLAEDLVQDYRLFADLLSLQPAQRSEAVAAMPPRLRQLAPGELARLAMRCGLDCENGSEKRAWQTRAGRMAPERLAETAARGIVLLRSWPHGISSWALDRVSQASDEVACRRDLSRRIRRIAWGDSGFGDQRNLLAEVFPNLRPPSKPGPLSADVTYTGREVDRMLPGFREYAGEIRELRLVPHRPGGNAGNLTTYLYSTPEIDAAAGQWNDSVSISSIMDQLQLPLYATEQFFEAQLLDPCDDPLLAVMLRRRMAIASNFDTLLKRPRRFQSRRARPSDSLPLSQESRRIGGAAKPWSDIYEALLNKRVPLACGRHRHRASACRARKSRPLHWHEAPEGSDDRTGYVDLGRGRDAQHKTRGRASASGRRDPVSAQGDKGGELAEGGRRGIGGRVRVSRRDSSTNPNVGQACVQTAAGAEARELPWPVEPERGTRCSIDAMTVRVVRR